MNAICKSCLRKSSSACDRCKEYDQYKPSIQTKKQKSIRLTEENGQLHWSYNNSHIRAK